MSRKDHLDCWTVKVTRPYKIDRVSAKQDWLFRIVRYALGFGVDALGLGVDAL